jgi:hypothetical protein
MNKIFRYTNMALLAAAIFAVGAVGTFAQDPCGDAAALTALDEKVREQLKDKSVPGMKSFVESGKQFIEKFGSCEPGKEFAAWLKDRIPKTEKAIKDAEELAAKQALLSRFNSALSGKNWDGVYTAGKEILQKYGDEFRSVELVLGSVGYDELFEKNNAKYNEETLRFAKQALASLESGKEFKPGFGVNPFVYKSKDDAIAWMNLTIGYITQVGQKNKSAAAPYLFKATQVGASDTSKNPIPYELIGSYYFDELNKLVDQIKAKEAEQKDTDTPEVIQQKVDDLKKLVAMSNGTAERAMDAFSRAYTLGQAPAYKAKMKKNVEDAYKLRFAKSEGVDAWIASAVAKPFVNPTTPIAPIADPEPTKTATTSNPGAGVGAATGTGVGAPNGTGIGKGNGTGIGAGTGTGIGPAAKPAAAPAKTSTSAPKPAKPGAKR